MGSVTTEALTIVLAAGTSHGGARALTGMGAGLLVLAATVAALGPAFTVYARQTALARTAAAGGRFAIPDWYAFMNTAPEHHVVSWCSLDCSPRGVAELRAEIRCVEDGTGRCER